MKRRSAVLGSIAIAALLVGVFAVSTHALSAVKITVSDPNGTVLYQHTGIQIAEWVNATGFCERDPPHTACFPLNSTMVESPGP